MSSGNTTEAVSPGEQTATAFLPTVSSDSKPRLRLTNKRKVTDSDGERTLLKNDDTEETDHKNEEPPRKSRKKAPAKLPKLAPRMITTSDFTNGQTAAGSTEGLAAVSRKRKAEDENAQISASATYYAESSTKARTKAAPTRKVTNQDPAIDSAPNEPDLAAQTGEVYTETRKKRKADTQEVENGDSPKDSVTESDAPHAKKPKRVSPRAKKPSPKRLAADAENKRRDAAKKMPPPPLPPAPITQSVANKVKQVRQFIDNEHNDYSRLDRDLENKHLISVPRSSLISAVIRMRVHYQMSQSDEEAIHDVEDAVVVKRFEQDIGPGSDVDWVVIDATKTSKFEDSIHEKIARHGLTNVNLLETELEMFKKELLKVNSLLDDSKEVAWDADRFLRTFRSIWDSLRTEEGDGEDLEGRDQPGISEEQEVGRTGVCVTPPIEPV